MRDAEAQTFLSDAEFDDPLIAGESRGFTLDEASDAEVGGRKFHRVLVTRNRHDFENLHVAWQHWPQLWRVTPPPEHAGILVIPDVWRPAQAARELDAFIQSGMPLRNALYRYHRRQGWLAWL